MAWTNIELTGLPDVSASEVLSAFVGTVDEMYDALLSNEVKAASIASDNGAMTIWLTDAGDYRLEVHVYMSPVASFRNKSLEKVYRRAKKLWKDFE